MFDGSQPDEIHVTDDGFALAVPAERVAPEDFPQVGPSPVIGIITEALDAAAAEDGALLDFDVRAFYTKHVAAALGLSPDDPPLRYDAFTATTLQEAFAWLRARGFLAHRGNGDSYDYWLARPFLDEKKVVCAARCYCANS